MKAHTGTEWLPGNPAEPTATLIHRNPCKIGCCLSCSALAAVARKMISSILYVVALEMCQMVPSSPTLCSPQPGPPCTHQPGWWGLVPGGSIHSIFQGKSKAIGCHARYSRHLPGAMGTPSLWHWHERCFRVHFQGLLQAWPFAPSNASADCQYCQLFGTATDCFGVTGQGTAPPGSALGEPAECSGNQSVGQHCAAVSIANC